MSAPGWFGKQVTLGVETGDTRLPDAVVLVVRSMLRAGLSPENGVFMLACRKKDGKDVLIGLNHVDFVVRSRAVRHTALRMRGVRTFPYAYFRHYMEESDGEIQEGEERGVTVEVDEWE